MSGLGGLNKSPNGLVIGLVQLQLPVVETPAHLQAQTEKIVSMVAKARSSMPTMDLVVFPEYALRPIDGYKSMRSCAPWTGQRSVHFNKPVSITIYGGASRSWKRTPMATRGIPVL